MVIDQVARSEQFPQFHKEEDELYVAVNF
jgi:hypothetical protein